MPPDVSVAALNDQFRSVLGCGPTPGRAVMTQRIASLPLDRLEAVLQQVRTFEAFTPANDPHGEHDCATIESAGGERVIWKIDYYADAEMEFGAESPLDAYRVLTIMFSEEY